MTVFDWNVVTLEDCKRKRCSLFFSPIWPYQL